MHRTPAERTASAQARARASERSTGFSQKIAFFAFAARRMRSACVSVDDAMITAATFGSSKTRSASTVCAPCVFASASPAARSTSTMYLSVTPGCRTMLPAWMVPIRPAPKSATSIMSFLLLQHPFVRRIVPELPFAARPRHHVQIIRFVAVRNDDRMVAARDHHDVAILDGERFVERAVVGVDALERESLRRPQPAVIRLLQRAFPRQVLGIVLVRRIARRVAARRANLDHQQVRRGLCLRQDI